MSAQKPKRRIYDPLKQPSPLSASAIVKAARASLKEPTRPVTPADAGRRLLQFDGYASRPQTSGGQVTRREFLLGIGDTSASTPPAHSSSNQFWRISSTSSTEAANAGQQLQPLAKPLIGSLVSAVAHHDTCCTSKGVGSAQYGSPLRPGSTLIGAAGPYSSPLDIAAVATGSSCTITPSTTTTHMHGLNQWQAVVPGAAGRVAVQDTAQSSNADDAAGAAGPCSNQQHITLRISRGSSSAGSSTGSSRGSTASADAIGGTPIEQAGITDANVVAMSAWQQEVVQVVTQLDSLPISPSAADTRALLQACAALQSLLDTAADQHCLQDRLIAPVATAVCTITAAGQAAGSEAVARGEQCMRDLVVAALVRLVDCPKPDVLIKVGSMLLKVLPVQGGMMMTAAKMLYSLSKDISNDTRFRHHGVVRPLLSVISQLSAACRDSFAVGHTQQHTASHKQLHGVLLYCTGCLKNVSADAANQKALGRLGAVALLAQVLNEQAEAAASVQSRVQANSAMQPEAAAQVCVQVTAVLRNIAVLPNHAVLFVQQQGLPLRALLQLLLAFRQQDEVLLNVSRCLSKLCLQGTCRDCMLQMRLHDLHAGLKLGQPNGGTGNDQLGNSTSAAEYFVQLLLRPMSAQPAQWPLVLRMSFVLGTLTTHHPEARTAVAAVPGALDGLLQLGLQLLHGQHLEQPGRSKAAAAATPRVSNVSVEDVLVKLLRLLGNVAIDKTAGLELVRNKATTEFITGVLHSHDFDQHEELVLNAAAAQTNLVYYNDKVNRFLQLDAHTLLSPLLPMLTSSSEEAVIEAARAISNFTRGSTAVQQALLFRDEPASSSSSSSNSPGMLTTNMQTTLLQAVRHCATPELPAATACVCAELKLSDLSQEPDFCYSSSTCKASGSAVGPYLLQALVLLLSHGSWEVVYNVAGALLNLTTSPTSFVALQQVQLMEELHAVLQRLLSEYSNGTEQASATDQDSSTWKLPAVVLALQCIYNLAHGMQHATLMGSQVQKAAAGSCSPELLQRLTEVLAALADAQVKTRHESTAMSELIALVLQSLSAVHGGGQ